MAQLPEHVDVVVVGAGLSGIGAGYRLQTECPDRSYLILEARDRLGGTWDLFRYPGIRSDSDMFTLGFAFEPWRSDRAIADGPAILEYLESTAAKYGIDRRIRCGVRVVAADWCTDKHHWTLTLHHARPDGTMATATMTCGFLYACAGYYNYEEPYDAQLPGLEEFAGRVVHPQSWPDDLDYADRRVVVIGSGATAVTLMPALATGPGAAAHVTMLQRTPSWILSLPGRDPVAERVQRFLPAQLAHRLVRAKNILLVTAFYQFCRRRPEAARRWLLGMTRRHVGSAEVAANFTPPYDPWDQRLCLVPDSDFFQAIRAGTADVVTDRIESVVPEGIRLASGRVLDADVVITATGLNLRVLGGIRTTVDGRDVPINEQLVWQGAMLTQLPNLAICVGYINASWTLRADLTARLVCRVLNHMTRHDLAAVVPDPEKDGGPGELRPLIDLSSGYVRRSIAEFPRQGARGVWRMRQNYPLDSATTLRSDVARTLAGTPFRSEESEPALST